MDKKYYLITIRVNRERSLIRYDTLVAGKHPVDVLIELQNEDDDARNDYYIVFYSEIPFDVYSRYLTIYGQGY